MMKRVSAILLSLALSTSLCLPTLAAGVTVDGKTVSDAEAMTMVPLRSVSEALGWTVTWDGSLPGARVETGQVHIALTLGKDTYQTVSSTAIGMSDPFSLGAAPTMLEPGTIYVPAELFQVLLGNREGTVSIGDDGSVSISQSGGTQVISPLHQHKTLAELRSAVGFDFPVPRTSPEPWQRSAGAMMCRRSATGSAGAVTAPAATTAVTTPSTPRAAPWTPAAPPSTGGARTAGSGWRSGPGTT